MYDIFGLKGEKWIAYERLNLSTENFHIQGESGTGKTYLLKTLLKNSYKTIAVVAQTADAAKELDGQTIHSFFGLSIGIQNPLNQEMLYRNLTSKIKQQLNSLDSLIIDEISLVRVDTMDMIDYKLRAARQTDEPFGGCQIIACGNIYEAPNVVNQDNELTDYLLKKYNTLFFYGAPGCKQKPFQSIILKQIQPKQTSSSIDYKDLL